MFRVHYDALGAIANLSRLTTVRQRVGRVAAAVAARARFDDARAGAVPLLPLVIVGGGGRFFLCPRVAVAGATPILSLRR